MPVAEIGLRQQLGHQRIASLPNVSGVEVVVVVECVYFVVELHTCRVEQGVPVVGDFYRKGDEMEYVHRVDEGGVGYYVGFEDNAFGQGVGIAA